MNETARQQFRQGETDEERSRLPKYSDESDIGLYRALELLRQPLCFDELVGDGFGPQDHPASVTHTGSDDWSTAMSGHVMRGGRHFVEFTTAGGINIFLGVIRPVSLTNGIDLEADWEGRVNPVAVASSFKPAVSAKLRSQRTAKWGGSSIHCCIFHCEFGYRRWTDWETPSDVSEWQGHEELTGNGTIGLLLDLDEGSLSVFKDGRRLGVMKEGLGGEYCWFVTTYSACTISIAKSTALR